MSRASSLPPFCPARHRHPEIPSGFSETALPAGIGEGETPSAPEAQAHSSQRGTGVWERLHLEGSEPLMESPTLQDARAQHESVPEQGPLARSQASGIRPSRQPSQGRPALPEPGGLGGAASDGTPPWGCGHGSGTPPSGPGSSDTPLPFFTILQSVGRWPFF